MVRSQAEWIDRRSDRTKSVVGENSGHATRLLWLLSQRWNGPEIVPVVSKKRKGASPPITFHRTPCAVPRHWQAGDLCIEFFSELSVE
jgi:hypothetical protein